MSKSIKAQMLARLNTNQAVHQSAPHEPNVDLGRQHDKIPVDLIDPNPYQPRTTFPQDELEQLAQSIQELGLIQPINVRRVGQRYQLIAGERRHRAHQFLKKHTIEAIIQEASESDMAVAALAENMDRADLSDYEIGKAIHQVEALFPSRSKLAEGLGLNREDMYKYFAFDALPAFILELLDANPRLLGRTAATDIKSMLTKTNGSPESLAALNEAVSLVVQKELDQSKIVDYVHRALRGESQRSGTTATPLLKDNKRVGSIKNDGKNIVVTLKTGALTEKTEAALHEFLNKLLAQ